MSTFSETVIELWNGWEIRVLLLVSLLLQVILIALGSVRKSSTSIWIRFFVWSAYLSADMVATVALGILARDINGRGASEQKDSKQSNTNSIQLFWTPFLILHLGGPDTITAYSLEDNELWPRHFLGLLFQIGVAAYVFVKNWDDIRLKWIAFPVFIAGIIKYGERTWVLRESSTKSIRDFLLSDSNPGPDYPEIMRRKKLDTNFKLSPRKVLPQKYSGSPDDYLSQAYYLFNRLKYLFADLILGYYERQDCHSMIYNKSSGEEAFELVEGELGLLYDELYTKATVVYSRYGFLLRCSSLLSSAIALIIFPIFIEHPYSQVDISITYLLLVGAIALDVYTFVLVSYSDWTKLWLANWLKQGRIGKRWSRTISKYNLIEFSLRSDNMWIRFQKLLGIEEMVEKHLNVDYEKVDAELQNLIFEQLKERSKNINTLFDVKLCKELLSCRGDNVLSEMKCLDLFEWSTIKVEFDHSLLLWHIATQLCYYDDVKKPNGSNFLENLNKYSKISKGLSDYMLYLLVMYPSMLPKGIGEIRYKDTCAEAARFFQQRRTKIGTKVDEACHALYEVDTDLLEEVKGDVTKSVLFYGSRLAQQLQSLGYHEDWGCEKKWDMIKKVWVELLAYAAVHCGWKEHGQQLRRGGELLTHVCLLMAHLGLSEQYQIQKEYFQIREDHRWMVQSAHPCDPFLLPLLFLCLAPYWCCKGILKMFSSNTPPGPVELPNLESLDFS